MRFLLLSLPLLMAGPVQGEEVVVFAAASLKTALDNVASDFQAEMGHRVTISYAGSNQLAQQIVAGAPADVFVSAAENWMDVVEAEGLIQAGSRRDLLGNDLVLIAHGAGAAPVEIGPETDLVGLLDGGVLAMALVDAVPAGQYGKAALEHLGLWADVAPFVAQTDNVRAALALVAAGEAPFGIVYASDAVADAAHVTVVATFPAESHAPITYPVALLAEGTDTADRAFVAALFSDAAKAHFTAQGFKVMAE